MPTKYKIRFLKVLLQIGLAPMVEKAPVMCLSSAAEKALEASMLFMY